MERNISRFSYSGLGCDSRSKNIPPFQDGKGWRTRILNHWAMALGKIINYASLLPDRLRKALMNKSYIAAFFLALLWLALAPVAFCSDITGKVRGPQGPVAGAQITVTGSGGDVVGQATTNNAGIYCIRGLGPGDYKTAVNPPAGAGFKTGTASQVISAEGLTEDWSLSSATSASSSSRSPGVCAAAYLGAYVAVGALGVATGLGLGLCAAEGCFSGSPTPVVSSSK